MIYWASPLKGDVNWREKWVRWTLINIGNAIRPLLLVCNGPLLIQPAPQPWQEVSCWVWNEQNGSACHKSVWKMFKLFALLAVMYLVLVLPSKEKGRKKTWTLKKTPILCDSSAVIVKDRHTMMWCPTLRMFFKELLWGLKETPNTMLALCAFLAWAEP